MRNRLIIFCLLLLGCVRYSVAQQLLIDRGIQVNNLWCFPLFEKPNSYVYLPSEAGITKNRDSLPEFSFMQYVFERAEKDTTGSTINTADGGAILHFLINYYTPQIQVDAAQDLLRSKFDNDEIIIRGPVIFDEAHFSLVSSVLNPTTGQNESQLIGIGKTPVLENSKIALSFDITPKASQILMESFKMATPDISLVFELGFSGLTDNYKATLEVDWEEVGKSQEFSAGGTVYFVSADVELGFEELRKNGAIKLTTFGSDESMDALLNTVYDKLITIMFDPVRPSELPDEGGGLTDAISSLIGADGMLSSGNTTGFGLHVGYKLKQVKTTGKGTMQFNGRSVVHRPHFVVANIGDLYKTHGENRTIFKRVTPDSKYKQREVHILVDGDLEKEFDELVNSVTISVKKEHQNGEISLKEFNITKQTYKSDNGSFSFAYLYKNDTIIDDWLKYQYLTKWHFRGGGTYTPDWKETDYAAINVYTPFRRKKIFLDGDLEILKSKGVKAISVKIEYDFFDSKKSDRITLRPTDVLNENFFAITLPHNIDSVAYNIDWVMDDRTIRNSEGIDEFGIIFIDELPEP